MPARKQRRMVHERRAKACAYRDDAPASGSVFDSLLCSCPRRTQPVTNAASVLHQREGPSRSTGTDTDRSVLSGSGEAASRMRSLQPDRARGQHSGSPKRFTPGHGTLTFDPMARANVASSKLSGSQHVLSYHILRPGRVQPEDLNGAGAAHLHFESAAHWAELQADLPARSGVMTPKAIFVTS